MATCSDGPKGARHLNNEEASLLNWRKFSQGQHARASCWLAFRPDAAQSHIATRAARASALVTAADAPLSCTTGQGTSAVSVGWVTAQVPVAASVTLAWEPV